MRLRTLAVRTTLLIVGFVFGGISFLTLADPPGRPLREISVAEALTRARIDSIFYDEGWACGQRGLSYDQCLKEPHRVPLTGAWTFEKDSTGEYAY